MWIKLLIGVLAVMFIGSLPVWPHTRKWSYGGAAGVAAVLAVVAYLTFLRVF